jgi:hypothetical protein
MICMATFGNGARTGTVNTLNHQRTIRKAPHRARAECFEAGAGTTPLRTVGRRTASGSRRRSPTTSSAFVLPEFRRVASKPGSEPASERRRSRCGDRAASVGLPARAVDREVHRADDRRAICSEDVQPQLLLHHRHGAWDRELDCLVVVD